MEKDITIAVHIEEDEATTTVHTVLDLMGDHFEARGRAKRNRVIRRCRSSARSWRWPERSTVFKPR